MVKSFTIKQGGHIPLGSPEAVPPLISPIVNQVALSGADYHYLKPALLVQEGDKVQIGSPIFVDKSNPASKHVSPVAGEVVSILRGAKRKLLGVIISNSSDEHLALPPLPNTANQQELQDFLIETGQWSFFRQRPFSTIPKPDSLPEAIFINGVDNSCNPVDNASLIKSREQDLQKCLEALISLRPEAKIFLSLSPNSSIDTSQLEKAGVEISEFLGTIASNFVGTHIHALKPIHKGRSVWHLGLQDALAIGSLLQTGKIDTHRQVSVSDISSQQFAQLRLPLGAHVGQALETASLDAFGKRLISGGFLEGRKLDSELCFLGQYARSIHLLEEDFTRKLFGWLSPGTNKLSFLNIYLSKLLKPAKYFYSTSTNGSERAILPLETFEKLVAIDTLVVPLLRSIVVGDIETAEKLGVLELDEEDIALCSFFCPGKYEYGPILRNLLTNIYLEDE